jgi:hypothetical protein
MGRIMKEVIVSYVVNTYVNVTMCPPVQLLYANKKIKTHTYINVGSETTFWGIFVEIHSLRTIRIGNLIDSFFYYLSET